VARITDIYKIPEREYQKIQGNFVSMDVARMEASLRDYGKDGDAVFRSLSDSMSAGTDGKEAIEDRHEIITQFLFKGVELVLLPELDPRRNFSEEEKLVLYARCEGRCQLGHNAISCNRRIDYHDAVVDHVVPHSAGGKTEIGNGRIAHRLCNISRGIRADYDPKTECQIAGLANLT
jgi:hypothetical protein